MHRSRLALIPAAALLVAACSSGGAVNSPAPSPPGSVSTAQTRIAVTMTDTLRFEPATMTVPAGAPVTFVVTNAGVLDHEFYLGDEAEQEQMMQSGEMVHGTPEGISLKPGETKELTYTFSEAGQTLAGCHFTGHYAGGMKAAITVTE